MPICTPIYVRAVQGLRWAAEKNQNRINPRVDQDPMIGWSRTFATLAKPVIRTTAIVSRNPVVTADLPQFESQFYRYQNELWKRLMWTFPKWFYYRVGTLSEQKFRELNPNPVYNNPNIEFPRGRPDIRQQRDRRFKQELSLPKTYSEAKEEDEVAANDNLSRKIVPNSRVTEADKKNDVTSLERKLARTLYLVVQQDGSWTFPTFDAAEDQALHTSAETGIYKLGGEKINYFNVSNTPCHVSSSDTSKTFYIKSHILSGKFEPQNGEKYMWLSKDELSQHLSNYDEIQHLLSDV